ncbi:MAG: alpha/beta fold hydrolase [Mariprofundaceae bacterium]|nr:alpha/beta fold hydrolase [Mariprofundaceae bacterium]
MTIHHHQKVLIQGEAGSLQGLYQPGELGKPALVVCHPHPLYGGTMRNKVVYWIARAFEDRGYSVLRFNFRGVEQSKGVWDEGKGEADDVIAALDWLEKKNPDAPLWLAGFSFGTYAGLQAARQDSRVQRMFVVAPAVNLWSFDFMQGETRPLTVVSGTADEIVPFEKVRAWMESMPEHVDFHAIDGAGHFFPKHMNEMTACLLDGMQPE